MAPERFRSSEQVQTRCTGEARTSEGAMPLPLEPDQVEGNPGQAGAMRQGRRRADAVPERFRSSERV